MGPIIPLDENIVDLAMDRVWLQVMSEIAEIF